MVLNTDRLTLSRGIRALLHEKAVLQDDAQHAESVVIRDHGVYMSDFDLAQDMDSRSFLYFAHLQSELICAELTPDCCAISGQYSVYSPKPAPPSTREAPARLTRNRPLSADLRHHEVSPRRTGKASSPYRVICIPWTEAATSFDHTSGCACSEAFFSQRTLLVSLPVSVPTLSKKLGYVSKIILMHERE